MKAIPSTQWAATRSGKRKAIAPLEIRKREQTAFVRTQKERKKRMREKTNPKMRTYRLPDPYEFDPESQGTK